jgi:hypothetical protein
MYRYLQADAGDGSQASRWCDALSIHMYDAEIGGVNDGAEGMIHQVARVQQMLKLTLPVLMTEFGFQRPDCGFRRADDDGRATLLRRHAAIQAALGLQSICFYSHDDDLIGNPSHKPVISRAIDELHHKLAGSILRRVTLNADGSVDVFGSNGTFHW